MDVYVTIPIRYVHIHIHPCMDVRMGVCMDACMYGCTKTSMHPLQVWMALWSHTYNHPCPYMHIAYTLVYSCEDGCVCEHIYYLLAVRQYHVQIDKPNQRSLLALKHQQLYENIQGQRVDFRMAFEKMAVGSNPLYYLQKEEENLRGEVKIF